MNQMTIMTVLNKIEKRGYKLISVCLKRDEIQKCNI